MVWILMHIWERYLCSRFIVLFYYLSNEKIIVKDVTFVLMGNDEHLDCITILNRNNTKYINNGKIWFILIFIRQSIFSNNNENLEALQKSAYV